MANTRTSENYKEYVKIDSAPGADGYWTNSISPRQINKLRNGKDIFFSIRDAGSAAVMTVTVQVKNSGDADWTDYGTATSVMRKLLYDKGAGVLWRAGVKNGDYTSGTFYLGFDW